jgi:hypothetical protein
VPDIALRLTNILEVLVRRERHILDVWVIMPVFALGCVAVDVAVWLNEAAVHVIVLLRVRRPDPLGVLTNLRTLVPGRDTCARDSDPPRMLPGTNPALIRH